MSLCKLQKSLAESAVKYLWGWLYSSCVQSTCSMLHGSETWPIRKENEVALQRAEMRMVRWMCGVNLQDRVPSKGLRERLWLDDIISVLQQNRLRWYGHVLRKEDKDWVKKCMEYEIEGARPRGRPKKTWTEIVEKDCQTRELNWEDTMDRSRWRKEADKGWLTTTIGVSGWMFLLVPAHPGCPGQNPESRKTVVCVCVCVC